MFKVVWILILWFKIFLIFIYCFLWWFLEMFVCVNLLISIIVGDFLIMWLIFKYWKWWLLCLVKLVVILGNCLVNVFVLLCWCGLIYFILILMLFWNSLMVFESILNVLLIFGL